MNKPLDTPAAAPSGIAYLTAICFVTTIGGFLFGYDTAVISGGIDLIQEQFSLSVDMKGWVVASALVGCILGAASCGVLADRFGRKPVLILSAFLLTFAAVFSCFPEPLGRPVFEAIKKLLALFAMDAEVKHVALTGMIVARIVGGLGIGITSMASPMYMSEVSPARYRGRMVSLYQLAITLGIVCSFAANAGLHHFAYVRQGTAGEGPFHLALIAEEWRGMFGAAAIPAILYFILQLFIPESPRWLIKQGRRDAARRVMGHMMTSAEMEQSIADVEETISHESNSILELFQPGFCMALLLGVALALFSQFCGINAIMYFGPTILKDVGFTFGGSADTATAAAGDAATFSAMSGAILIGVINCLFTFVAILKVDSFGRRPLLLVGASGVFLSLIGCVMAFSIPGTAGLLKLLPILTFCACFSFSYGPVCWVVIGEIFPTRVRGRAVAVATGAVWIGAFTVSQSFPRMLDTLHAWGTFAVYAGITAVAVVFIWAVLPETKGRTLEEIERDWTRPH